METQIFLKLVRQSGPSPDMAAALVAKLFAPIAPGVIGGDAIFAPFIKWINVTGFKNSVGFNSGTVRAVGDALPLAPGETEPKYQLKQASYGKSAGSVADSNRQATVDDAAFRQAVPAAQAGFTYRGTVDRWGQTEATYENRRGMVRPTQYAPEFQAATGIQHSAWKLNNKFSNKFLKLDLPEHNDLEFTKFTDNATPQIAYACSSQEPIPLACFFFRRKIGAGVKGIRLPYLAVVAKKCLITGWELNGDQETVTLQYEQIQWCTYDQLTDWNLPTGMSNRYWNTKEGGGSGGEDPWMYLFMAAVGAIITGVGIGLDVGLSPSPAADSSPGDLSQIE